jgi:hypothetical protein
VLKFKSRATSREVLGGRNGTGKYSAGSFGFPWKIIIPPLLHTHLSPPFMKCDITLTTQHIITPSVSKFGASSLCLSALGQLQSEKLRFYRMEQDALTAFCVLLVQFGRWLLPVQVVPESSA